MSNPAITVENMSKQYRIGIAKKSNASLRQAAMGMLASPFQQFRKLAGHTTEEDRFWALRDVSFSVDPGEVVGLIGSNGAGKSTLLKILSRITDPSHGQARINGRVASLLEVGSGFHRELTGRENVYLNGTILGMRKTEIDSKFDEIVAFAEVEKFIDTPVKHYSSGMHTRLAFAVAAHLQPEILLVDEVLAVGDAVFQKKCLGKMGSVAKQGRTILFVSHNMAAVESLCTRGIVLRQGMLELDAPTDVVISRYLRGCQNESSDADSASIDIPDDAERRPGSTPAIHHMRLCDIDGNERNHFGVGETIVIEFTFDADRNLTPLLAGLAIDSIVAGRIATFNNQLHAAPSMPHSAADGTVRFVIPNAPFVPGEYQLTPGIWTGNNSLVDAVERCMSFTVLPRSLWCDTVAQP